jgi:hypothetical protein
VAAVHAAFGEKRTEKTVRGDRAGGDDCTVMISLLISKKYLMGKTKGPPNVVFSP